SGGPFPCIIKGKPKLGRVLHRKTCTTVTFTQVNWEDKGALAKLVEAIRTNYNNRYDEICHHCRGNVLGPKSVAHITTFEKGLASEWAHELILAKETEGKSTREGSLPNKNIRLHKQKVSTCLPSCPEHGHGDRSHSSYILARKMTKKLALKSLDY
uniref:60S ribosomal protein L7a n=1 Tax=Callithrix jacchus TaxID=9483 RepID=A0A8I3X1L4_CALJA